MPLPYLNGYKSWIHVIASFVFYSLPLTECITKWDSLRGPIFITEPPDKMDFSNTTGATLECAAHGHPSPAIRWVHFDDTTVDNVMGIREVHTNGSLGFRPFPAEFYRQDIHAGKYYCIASSALGTIRSRPVYVRAVVQQYYEVQVYDEYVIVENTAVLKCHIPPFVREHVHVTSWIRNHNIHIRSSVEKGHRYAMLSTGELYIYKVRTEDSRDTFRCQTLNRLTQEVKISAPGHIIVSDPKSSVSPRIIHSHSTVTVAKGSTAELPCVTQGLPVPTHEWYKLENSLLQPVLSDERREVIAGVVIIRNSMVSDGGTYICKVNNIMGEEKLETILNVYENLSAYVEPQEITVDVGGRVRFTCVASGHPITSVKWLKDGQVLEPKAYEESFHKYILVIEKVDAGKRGMYQCVVSNDETSSQGTTELKLGAVSPVIRGKFPSSPIKPESNLMIQCLISGSPIPIVNWYLDDHPLVRNNRVKITESTDPSGNYVSSVTISSVKVQDSGYYRCLAKNDAGEVDHVSRVDVHGPLSVKKMLDVVANRGSRILVPCPISGYPIDSIFWKKGGSVLPVDRRQKVFSNGTLWIENLSKSDEGLYTCFVRNNAGQSAQGSRTIKVTVPPVIDPQSFLSRLVLHVGTRTRLQCVISEGDLPLTIHWLKDGRPFVKDFPVIIRKEEDFASVLAISNISSIHQGKYTCIAKNAAASVNITTDIIVEIPPRWIKQPADTSVFYQADAMLDCSAEGSPAPVITWKKSSGRFPGNFIDLPLTSRRHLVLSNGSLLIHHVTEEDEGSFICEVHNGIGMGLNKIVILHVQAPARIPIKFQNKTSKRGDMLQLECKVHGDEPLTIAWLKDSISIAWEDNNRIVRNDYNVSGGFMSELIIARIDRQDTGTYTCLASNAFGRDESQIHVNLREQPDPPENVRISDFTSKQVHLSWSAPSDRARNILRYVVQYKLSSEEWKQSLKNITVNSSKTFVMIDDLHPGTAYSFRVLAENDIGFGKPSTGVAVTTAEEVPSGKPWDVQVEATGSQTLLVTWKTPPVAEINGELLGYYVGFKVHNSVGAYNLKTVETHAENGEQKVILDSLLKYTKYSIVVQAFNRAGAGPPSLPVIGQTDEDVPSEAPESIVCHGVSSKQLNVSWQMPPPHSHNGKIIGYRVLFRAMTEDGDEDEEIAEMKATSSLNLILNDLQKWTNYSVSVMAFTQVGNGKKSHTIHCQTLEDVPTAPADVLALVVSSTSLLTVWKKPLEPNGIITKYTVYMRETDSVTKQTVKFVVLSSKPLQYQMTGLQEDRRFEFWVTASTSVGEGESTRVVSQTPSSKGPARIATFQEYVIESVNNTVVLPCQVVGSAVINAEWKLGQVVLKESKFLQPLADNSLRLFKIQRSDSGNYSCTAHNKFGSDDLTHILRVRAPPDSPSFQVTTTTSSTIHLIWQLKDDGGTPIQGFVLHYKREFDEWENLHIHRTKNNFTLLGLRCGTQYQLYMTAYNKIDFSEPSDIKTVYTNGTVPGMPTINDVIRINTTSIELYVSNWPDNGCRIRYFVVQYLDPDDLEWVLVSNSVQPENEQVLISDLKSSAFYKISVTAHNDAGTTVVHYDVVTLPGSLSENPSTLQKEEFYYLSLSFLVPLVAALIAIIAIFTAAWILLKHRTNFHRSQRTARNMNVKEGEEQNDAQLLEALQGTQPSSTTACLRDSVCKAESIYDDVCPYATSNIMEAIPLNNKCAIPMRTFAQTEENQYNSGKYSKVVKERGSFKGKMHPHQKISSLEDLYNLYQAASEVNKQNQKVDDHFSSDWNIKDKLRNQRLTQFHERPQVPDLLYHGTDSSTPTPNDTSPDDLCVWSMNNKDYFDCSHPSYYPESGPHQCTLGYPNCQCQRNEIQSGYWIDGSKGSHFNANKCNRLNCRFRVEWKSSFHDFFHTKKDYRSTRSLAILNKQN